MISAICNSIFDKCIVDYHVKDNVDTGIINEYSSITLEHLLYAKNWIDTVQWHLEDIVRNPSIDAAEGLLLKRRIDKSNQVRTDMVEHIDEYFLNKYNSVAVKNDATINTESPAWAIDRLSILALKIFHMQAEVSRKDATEQHIINCNNKLSILLEQRKDLSKSIDELIADIEAGNKKMKVYVQMKMYNDPSLNPILYQQQSK